ncbi:MAG: peptidylprolyl isomerase [Nitrospinales bacterium]
MAENKSNSDEKDSASDAEPVIPKPPVIKPRKAFVVKKFTAPTDKPMEHRVRHIRLSAKESADLFWQTTIDFQNELAAEPTDDPDKEYADREKVEAFIIRLAKKYSICPSHSLGGELGWISPGMSKQEIIPQELIAAVLNGKRFVIPEPIKTPLGYHIVLICESRVCKKAMEEKSGLDPRYEALAGKDRPEARAPTRSDIPT